MADDVAISTVGAAWGDTITSKALQGLAIFLVLVVIYLGIRFELKMAVGAVVALLHDLALTAGIYALLGFEVTPATIIGLLTILGYSLYDTVVVFDKVQENTRGVLASSRATYGEAANLALNQVLARSINTSVIALLPVAGLLFVGAGLLGASTLVDLSLALFVGIAVGTYSSIFLATPVLVALKEREPVYVDLARRVAARRAGKDVRGVRGVGDDGDGRGGDVVAGTSASVLASSSGPLWTRDSRPAAAAWAHLRQPRGPPVSAAERLRGLLEARTRLVPDFPEPGVSFQDLAPLWADPSSFADAVDAMSDLVDEATEGVDAVLAVDSRGFLVGAPLALARRVPLVLARKEGKTPVAADAGPDALLRETYDLEYGSAALEVRRESLEGAGRVLVVDDVLATGGTLAAALALVERSGARTAGALVLVEIGALDGRRRLGDAPLLVGRTV